MADAHFDWDAAKARANERKHRVSFDEAASAFFDEDARLIADPEHSADEERFVLLGRSARMRLLVVCHCSREADSVFRIISARAGDRREADAYAENLT